MKLTKEKRVYGAVLGIAVAALAADRLFGSGDQGGPATAEANASVYSAMPTSQTTATMSAGATVSVAEQLASLDKRDHLDTASTNNAFATWKTQPEHPAAAPTPAATAVADQFRQNHHLTGVMIAGQRAFAVVDGTMIAVGQSVEGVKLVSVTQRSATWLLADGPQFAMAIEDHAAHRIAAR